MTTASKTTTDHDPIWRWAGARHRTPAAVRATESDDHPGVLRIGFRDERTDEVSDWDEFFAGPVLALLYQDKTVDGGTSRLHKLVDRS